MHLNRMRICFKMDADWYLYGFIAGTVSQIAVEYNFLFGILVVVVFGLIGVLYKSNKIYKENRK